MHRVLAMMAAFGLVSAPALAQLDLPGAALPESPAADEAAKPAKPKHHLRKSEPPRLAADPAALSGRVLRLNGRNGELQFERGDDKSLKIVKYTLLGEVASQPSQQCRIDIVADKPIEATSEGEPDGLQRYSANIPACPLTFDVVADGVVVPPQNNACLFSAADCQASPSGLWGPDGAELDKDPKAISRARAAADRSIQDSLRALEKRDKDAAASLAREQNDFAAERDDLCRDYVGETRLGFCASRIAQTRAALLAKRAAEHDPQAKKRKKKAAP